MNIFMLTPDPYECAMSMIDRHIVKMPLESAQLLSTAHRVLDGEPFVGLSKKGKKMVRWKLNDARDNVVYLASHVNNPLAIWARTTVDNYNWLADHMFALLCEYTHRYNKHHKIEGELSYMLSSPPNNLRRQGLTKMPVAMYPQYVVSDDIYENYKNYYNRGKRHDNQGKPMLNYTNREAPDWLDYETVTEYSSNVRGFDIHRRLYT